MSKNKFKLPENLEDLLEPLIGENPDSFPKEIGGYVVDLLRNVSRTDIDKDLAILTELTSNTDPDNETHLRIGEFSPNAAGVPITGWIGMHELAFYVSAVYTVLFEDNINIDDYPLTLVLSAILQSLIDTLQSSLMAEDEDIVDQAYQKLSDYHAYKKFFGKNNLPNKSENTKKKKVQK